MDDLVTSVAMLCNARDTSFSERAQSRALDDARRPLNNCGHAGTPEN